METPTNGMRFGKANSPYVYSVIEADGNTLKVQWTNTETAKCGYSEMCLDYYDLLFEQGLIVAL